MIAAVLGMLALAGCIALIDGSRQKASSPLGPRLDMPTRTLAPTSTAAVETPESLPAAARGAGPVVTPGVASELDLPRGMPTAPAKPVCGGPEAMLLLGIGSDGGGYLYGLSDVIRIARIDFIDPGVAMLSLPRDLWVEIPGIEANYGITHGKINQAYLYGGPGMGYYDGPAGGPGLLARTIQHNYGLTVDHYAAADMHVFVRFVDALGGIDIDLPYDVDGGTLDGGEGAGYYAAGKHHFNGETALKFARIRMKYSDFQRQENQTLVLLAIRDKLLSPGVVGKIPDLIEAFEDSVLTDLSLEQIGQLVCLMRHVGRDRIVMLPQPKGLYEVGWTFSPVFKKNTSIVRADPEALSEYLARFAEGILDY